MTYTTPGSAFGFVPSEQAAEAAPEAAEDTTQVEEQETEQEQQDTFPRSYVEELRREAADWRTKYQDANKAAKSADATAKAAATAEDRLAAVEAKLAEADLRALRLDVALEHKLGKDDAALLNDLHDEEAMRRFAARLSAASGKDEKPVMPKVSTNGNRSKGGASTKEALSRALLGN